MAVRAGTGQRDIASHCGTEIARTELEARARENLLRLLTPPCTHYLPSIGETHFGVTGFHDLLNDE
jgi:hypothetical protein